VNTNVPNSARAGTTIVLSVDCHCNDGVFRIPSIFCPQLIIVFAYGYETTDINTRKPVIRSEMFAKI
jgi:hypothetical protein